MKRIFSIFLSGLLFVFLTSCINSNPQPMTYITVPPRPTEELPQPGRWEGDPNVVMLINGNGMSFRMGVPLEDGSVCTVSSIITLTSFHFSTDSLTGNFSDKQNVSGEYFVDWCEGKLPATVKGTWNAHRVSDVFPKAEDTTVTVIVPAEVVWFDTGITIEAGQKLNFNAAGKISTYIDEPEGDMPGPDGGYDPCTVLDDSDCLLPGSPYGSLVGKIDDGDPFFIGSSASMMANTSGVLYMAVNDNQIYYGDNSGEFTVTITYGRN